MIGDIVVQVNRTTAKIRKLNMAEAVFEDYLY